MHTALSSLLFVFWRRAEGCVRGGEGERGRTQTDDVVTCCNKINIQSDLG